MALLYSIVESPSHPNFSSSYVRLGIDELRFGTIRKAVQALKNRPPDIVVAEFFYGYGNNYAGANLGNLDVLLSSLQKYSPRARVIVMVAKDQRPYAAQLGARFPLAAILEHPVEAVSLERQLQQAIPHR